MKLQTSILLLVIASVFPVVAAAKCESGYYFDPSKPLKGCQIAPPGHFSKGFKLRTCPVGTFQPKKGRAGCRRASAGYFVPGEGARRQQACPAGSYQDEPGQPRCKGVRAGYFVPGEGATAPTAAAPGYFVSGRGATRQIPAPPGRYVAREASLGSSVCPAGTYQPAEAQTTCRLAVDDYYSDAPGQANVKNCPGGTFGTRRSGTGLKFPADTGNERCVARHTCCVGAGCADWCQARDAQNMDCEFYHTDEYFRPYRYRCNLPVKSCNPANLASCQP